MTDTVYWTITEICLLVNVFLALWQIREIKQDMKKLNKEKRRVFEQLLSVKSSLQYAENLKKVEVMMNNTPQGGNKEVLR